MVKIYVDASFNDANPNTNIIGGVGIVVLHYDYMGNMINEEYYAKRYTKKDILALMDFKVNKLSLKNSILEFIALFECFNLCEFHNEEIIVYSDWNEINKMFQFEYKCKSLFRREPNLKSLFYSFKNSEHYLDNLIYVKHVKGHNQTHYNCVADFLANYWLDCKLAVKTVLDNYDFQSLHNAKLNIYMTENRRRKVRQCLKEIN